MRSLIVAFFGVAAAKFPNSDTQTCPDSLVCQVDETTTECCTHGSCIPHVGCRCREGELCDTPNTPIADTCPDSLVCKVDETTTECCTHGSCIPHVGCRCREGELCDTILV